MSFVPAAGSGPCVGDEFWLLGSCALWAPNFLCRTPLTNVELVN